MSCRDWSDFGEMLRPHIMQYRYTCVYYRQQKAYADAMPLIYLDPMWRAT